MDQDLLNVKLDGLPDYMKEMFSNLKSQSDYILLQQSILEKWLINLMIMLGIIMLIMCVYLLVQKLKKKLTIKCVLITLITVVCLSLGCIVEYRSSYKSLNEQILILDKAYEEDFLSFYNLYNEYINPEE